jgi:hypothetical protein
MNKRSSIDDQGPRVLGVEGSSEKHNATSYPDISGYPLVFRFFKYKIDSRLHGNDE